jgi:hypothetical protein
MRKYNVPVTPENHFTRLSSAIFESVSKVADSGKDFLEVFKRLDQRKNMKISVGQQVSILNLRMSQDFAELFGFKTPKKITKIYREPTDNKIIQLEFNNDPEDIWPRKNLASYNGQLIMTSAFFPNAQTLEKAITMLQLSKPDNITIRTNISEENQQDVAEGNGILGFIMPDRVQSKKKKQDTTDPYAERLVANRKKQKNFWAEPEAKIGQKPKAPHREKIMPESSEDIISAKQRLADLEKQFDSSYEYSDDHSVWKKHNEIRQEMNRLKKIIGQDVTEAEDNPFELEKKHPMNHGMKKFMIRQIVKNTEYGTSELSLASDEELTQLFNEVVPNAQELTKRFIGFLSEKIAEEKESRLYKQHQKIRKEKGLPDPSHYKKMAQQKQKEIDALNAEIASDKANLKEDYLEEN